MRWAFLAYNSRNHSTYHVLWEQKSQGDTALNDPLSLKSYTDNYPPINLTWHTEHKSNKNTKQHYRLLEQTTDFSWKLQLPLIKFCTIGNLPNMKINPLRLTNLLVLLTPSVHIYHYHVYTFDEISWYHMFTFKFFKLDSQNSCNTGHVHYNIKSLGEHYIIWHDKIEHALSIYIYMSMSYHQITQYIWCCTTLVCLVCNYTAAIVSRFYNY